MPGIIVPGHVCFYYGQVKIWKEAISLIPVSGRDTLD